MRFVKSVPSRTLLFLASINLVLLAAVPAQDPPDRVADSSIETTIKSGSGQERHPLHYAGRGDRIGLGPGQTVNVALKFPGKGAGESVAVGALDGGTLTGQESLATSADGMIQFAYQGGLTPGRYRVLVQIAEQQYSLEFYVLDTSNPGKNPPRVRIVP